MGIETVMCRTQQRLRELHTSKSSASSAKVIGAPRQESDIFSRSSENLMPELRLGKVPEDIFRCIYALVPLQDAARAACVSHGFLRCWRSYPSLIFNNQTLGLDKRWLDMDEEACELDDTESYVTSKIDHVLKNHSGIGVKVLQLELFPCPNINASDLDRWFEFIVKPGIEELALKMSICENKTEYDFPCSLLSNKAGGGTLQSLSLASCTFHPTVTPFCNRSLRSLDMWSVHISGEELGQFVSNCLALEKLKISHCNDIICFKVPSPMQQLHYLWVTTCEMLQVIEVNAPKLSTFIYGEKRIQISLGDPLQVKHVYLLSYNQPNMVCYARTELPSMMPNIETLDLSTPDEMMSTPMVPSKFLHLKNLDIHLHGSRGLMHSYDFFSLVSFLDASPTLETFILRVEQDGLRHDSILEYSDGDQLHLRRIPEYRHDNLKNVTITGFNSAKSMVELTNHILENASSLKCITLDTVCTYDKLCLEIGECEYMSKEDVMEALQALEAIRRYIEGKVPLSVNLKVLGPCSKCYSEFFM